MSGAATLTCDPVDGGGQPRNLDRDVVETLSFPVTVVADDGQLCTSAEVAGALFDPVTANNSAGGCVEVAPPPVGLVLTKDDGVSATKGRCREHLHDHGDEHAAR